MWVCTPFYTVSYTHLDADNRLQTAINQKADKTTVAENTAAIESNKAAIAQEKKDRDHADQKLQDQITINKGQIENEATNRANEDLSLIHIWYSWALFYA